MNSSYDNLDYSADYTNKNGDLSLTDTLLDFERLRISALTKAAEISPLVKDVTIGPKSPLKNLTINVSKCSNNDINKTNEPEENLFEDKLKDDLRYTIIMKEYERNLRESSQELFKNLVEKMITKRADMMRNYWQIQTEKCDLKTLELRTKKIQMLRNLHDNDNLSVLEKAKLDEQNSEAINKTAIENMNRILEEQNKATSRFASITDSHTKICINYNEITSLMHTEPLLKEACDKYINPINTVLGNINIIMDMSKSGNITDKDVKQAEILALNIDNIRKKILDDLIKIKSKEALQKKQEEEAEKIIEDAKLKEEEAKAQLLINTKIKSQSSKKSPPMFFSSKRYSYFKDLQNYLNNYELQYKDLLENTNMKKFRFDCQKAVNTPVNALSSVSGAHIKDKYNKLFKLLKGERVQVLDTYVTVTEHPQGLAFVTALLAKKIVRQGDLLVSSNSEAAYPLAAVTVALCSQFPDFGKLLEAYFHRYCPYLVPMLLPQSEGQTDKDFYLSRGYTYNDEGTVEKQDKFLRRMSGIFRLQCAIWIAKTPRFLNTSNPYGLNFGWQWLSSFINLKPEPDICATLIHDFFSVCGSDSLKVYNRQFVKLIKLISSNYLPILEKIDEGGPKTRLEVFLQNVLKTGQIPPPTSIPPNTW